MRQTEFSEEELRKFQRFFNLAEADDADIEIEEKYDLYDQYFTTASEAKAYNDWFKAKKAKKPKESDATTAAPSPAQPVQPDPYPLDVYRSQLESVDFTDVDSVAGFDPLPCSTFLVC